MVYKPSMAATRLAIRNDIEIIVRELSVYPLPISYSIDCGLLDEKKPGLTQN